MLCCLSRQRFVFAWARSYQLAAAGFGILPRTAWVDVDERTLDARFGPWRLSTPRSNIAEVAVTGPYHWWMTAGPARLGVTDRGLTFATNGDRGVLVTFREKVRSVGPFVLLLHPELTVTVGDIDGLALALSERR